MVEVRALPPVSYDVHGLPTTRSAAPQGRSRSAACSHQLWFTRFYTSAISRLSLGGLSAVSRLVRRLVAQNVHPPARQAREQAAEAAGRSPAFVVQRRGLATLPRGRRVVAREARASEAVGVAAEQSVVVACGKGPRKFREGCQRRRRRQSSPSWLPPTSTTCMPGFAARSRPRRRLDTS